MPRFVLTQKATTDSAALDTAHDVVASLPGARVVASHDNSLLVECEDDVQERLASELGSGWAIAREKEYAIPRGNPALDRLRKMAGGPKRK